MGKGIFEIFVCMVFFFFSIRKSVIMDSMSKEKKGKETENQIEEKRSQTKISVRNLVEFIFREGDIDNRAWTVCFTGSNVSREQNAPQDPEADGQRLSCRSAAEISDRGRKL